MLFSACTLFDVKQKIYYALSIDTAQKLQENTSLHSFAFSCFFFVSPLIPSGESFLASSCTYIDFRSEHPMNCKANTFAVFMLVTKRRTTEEASRSFLKRLKLKFQFFCAKSNQQHEDYPPQFWANKSKISNLMFIFLLFYIIWTCSQYWSQYDECAT